MKKNKFATQKWKLCSNYEPTFVLNTIYISTVKEINSSSVDMKIIVSNYPQPEFRDIYASLSQ